MNHFGVIMAGGGGTRFWPLSRQNKPKQFLNLSGKDVMINESIDRISTVIGKSNIFIVTSESQTSSMIAITEGKVFPQNILSEPVARNTAACIGYAAIEIVKRFGDGIMLIIPADHYIKDSEKLTEIFRLAIEEAENKEKLLTIGIKPTFPSTGYGYIRYCECDGLAKTVCSFTEKPEIERAARYIKSGEYLWNSGIFVWKASLILKMLKEYAGDIYSGILKIGEAINTPEEQFVLHSVYPDIRNISIDYAIMEPCAENGDVLVIPGDFGWNDIGSWDMMDVLYKKDNNDNVFVGDVVGLGVKDSVVYSSGRNITVLGVENIVVVETSDTVLVCKKDKTQSIKEVVEYLKSTGRKELL